MVPYEAVLKEFPDFLRLNFKGSVKHRVHHHIVTSGPPLHAKAWRLNEEKLQIAREEFTKMEEMGIIRRSNSPWASPLHVVPKADDS